MQQPFLHIKKFFGKKVLTNQIKKYKKRKVKSCNINEANSFGILCVVKEEDDYKKVVKLIKYLKDEFGIRNIKALAFYPKKDDPHFLQSKLGLDYYKLKDLNWFCMPTINEARNFMNENFDILLDIIREKEISQRFVLHYSKAYLKVGTYSSENEPFYDMMIDLNGEDFEEYINQVVTYLNMLNKSEVN